MASPTPRPMLGPVVPAASAADLAWANSMRFRDTRGPMSCEVSPMTLLRPPSQNHQPATSLSDHRRLAF